MTKDQKASVVEYAATLSEEECRSLNTRLNERLFGDLAEAVEFMSKNPKMDEILLAVQTADEFFNTCDQIRDLLNRESKKKGPGPRQN